MVNDSQLAAALRLGGIDKARRLLEEGADHDGNTPLDLAKKVKRKRALEVLTRLVGK